MTVQLLIIQSMPRIELVSIVSPVRLNVISRGSEADGDISIVASHILL